MYSKFSKYPVHHCQIYSISNPQQTTPPPENPPSTQPLEHHCSLTIEHHSLLRHSPHTTTPQNPPTEQAL
jgi:hypothetical protein